MLFRCRGKKATLWGAFFTFVIGAILSPAYAERAAQYVPHDGDILLFHDTGPIDDVIAGLARPIGSYTHADVYIDSPNQGGLLVSFNKNGVRVKKFTGISAPLAYEIAVVRAVHPPRAGSFFQALTTLEQRHQVFDFGMRWPALESRQTYCAGFISQLYRLAGAPDPFPLSSVGRGDDSLDQAILRILDFDLSAIVSPSAPLYSPDFTVVMHSINKSPGVLLRKAVAQVIVERIKHYVSVDGLVPLTSSLGDAVLLALADNGIAIGDLPIDKLSPRQRDAFMAVYEFIQVTQERVLRTIYLHPDEVWDDATITEITESVADGYRDHYFQTP